MNIGWGNLPNIKYIICQVHSATLRKWQANTFIMKKHSILTILVTLVFLQGVGAQMLDQGNFIIGSTLGFSKANSKISLETADVNTDEKGHDATQFSISPKVGYFLLDNFALGIGMDYTFSTVKEPNQNRTDDSDLLFGPFGRFYYPITEDMALIAETNVGFGNSNDHQTIGGEVQDVNTNIFAIGVGPGFTIFSSSGIGVEALFKYNFARSKFDTDINGARTSRITRTNQFDISLGIQFYFGGMKRIGT